MRAGLFKVIDLGDIPLVGTALADVLRRYPDLEHNRLVHETVRRVISAMVQDVLAEAKKNFVRIHPKTVEDVHNANEALAKFSAQMSEYNRILQQFLSQQMYRHPRVMDIMGRAQRVIDDLFNAYMNDETLLPNDWRDLAGAGEKRHSARQVCDFIAGMTDRYALEQHKRLFDLDPLFR